MSNNSHKARVIPDQYLPLVEQGLLNLALKGDVRIIRDGHDITKSLTAQAGRINKADPAWAATQAEVARNKANAL
jgi:hypothetical protein